MIIDLHRHLWSIFERYPEAQRIAAGRGISGVTAHEDTPDPFDIDIRSAQILAEMDEAGIDCSVLLLGDYGVRLGEPRFDIEQENRFAVDIAERSPGRFVAFYGIDPRRPGAASMFADAVTTWGVGGLKLHPGAGFSPDDPVCFPLYEIAREHNVPVAVHTGPIASPLISKYARPLALDEPAALFPETNFILLHAGQRGAYPEALDLARWKPNIYLELSAWQADYRDDRQRFAYRIGEMKNAIGLDRVLFGTDAPGTSGLVPVAEWTRVFRTLPEWTGEFGVSVSQDEADLICGGTARGLLHIDDRPADRASERKD